MKVILNAACAAVALLSMSAAFSVAVAATPDGQAPPMTLLHTDTADVYPFAAIEVGNQVYHVTEGDVLDGVTIRHIAPGRVSLSTDQVLVAGRALRPDVIPGSPDGQVAHDDGR